jgi:drug/metabolite transporter (DMT)-like permease
MAFVALGVIWGIPYFFIKLALQELSPAVVAFSRLVLATAVLLPIAWQRGALRSVRGHLWAIGAFALVEFVIPFTAICFGERWISSSVTGILIATVPLWIAVMSRWFGVHEPLGAWRLLGLVLGFIGVATLLGFGTISGLLGWAGVGCMLIATLGYAAGPLIVQRHLGGLDSYGPLAMSLLMAALVMVVPALLSLPDHMPSGVALGSIVILGVICTALAMLLMFFLIADAGASRSSVITYINPAVAALLGTVVLHESLGWGGIAAFALILLGSWLATRGKPARRVAAGAA